MTIAKNNKKIDDFLLSILVCPLSKGKLRYDEKANELICDESKLAYRVEDGVPIMLVDEARKVD